MQESPTIERTPSSQYIGVSYIVSKSKWRTNRHSKHDKKELCNGYYDNEETAAHASDTLARKLMANGEQSHRLNFPDDETEVFQKVTKSRKLSRKISLYLSVKEKEKDQIMKI